MVYKNHMHHTLINMRNLKKNDIAINNNMGNLEIGIMTCMLVPYSCGGSICQENMESAKRSL